MKLSEHSDRKISETILDFGEPLPAGFEGISDIQSFRDAMLIVITIWNAHVLAMPEWGCPEALKDWVGS
jgi:hypothetical protein